MVHQKYRAGKSNIDCLRGAFCCRKMMCSSRVQGNSELRENKAAEEKIGKDTERKRETLCAVRNLIVTGYPVAGYRYPATG